MLRIIITFVIFTLIVFEVNGKLKERDEDEFDWGTLRYVGLINRKHYYIGNLKMHWSESLEFCHMNGMKLATIKSQEENEFIHRFLSETDISPFPYVWLSATDLFDEGNFTWMEDKSPVEFSNWTEERSNGTKYNCVWFYNDGTWDTCECSFDSNRSLCQFDSN